MITISAANRYPFLLARYRYRYSLEKEALLPLLKKAQRFIARATNSTLRS